MANTNDPIRYDLEQAALQRSERAEQRRQRVTPPAEPERIWCVTADHGDGERRAVYTGCTRDEAVRYLALLHEYTEPRIERAE